MGINIDVVADTVYDWLGKSVDKGYLQRALEIHPGALRTITINDFVMKIEKRLGPSGKIGLLRVFGHGDEGIQTVAGGYNGEQEDLHRDAAQSIMMRGNKINGERDLARLKGRFDTDGRVELHGCNVAGGNDGRQLLAALARLWSVPVWAGVIDQEPDKYDYFEGEAIEVRPDGTVRAHRGGKYRMLPNILPPPSTEQPATDSTVKEIHTVGTTVKASDWLSNLALKHYNDLLLWPIIWRRNKGPTFTNPNRISPGQKIVIPVKPNLTKAEETAIRTEAKAWRDF